MWICVCVSVHTRIFACACTYSFVYVHTHAFVYVIAPIISTNLKSEPHSLAFLLSLLLLVSNTFPAHSWEVSLSHEL